MAAANLQTKTSTTADDEGRQRLFSDELLLFIHEPARLVLLTTLAAVKKADFVFLLNSTELSRGNLSVQLTRLQERELVEVEKTFEENRPRSVYEITRKGRSALNRYKKELLARFDALTF